jgi:hypothetical protein
MKVSLGFMIQYMSIVWFCITKSCTWFFAQELTRWTQLIWYDTIRYLTLNSACYLWMWPFEVCICNCLCMYIIVLIQLDVNEGGSLLRHCATSLKFAGSIPDGVTEIFHWHNPTGSTMALGSTQLLTEMRTRRIFWGDGCKDGRCVGLTTLPPPCADCLEIWEPQSSGTLMACSVLYRDCCTFC